MSFANPFDVFIEKMNEEQFRDIDSSNFKPENFVYDYLIKRDIDFFKTTCSLFRAPFNPGQNPFTFCNANSYSSNNTYLESIKVSGYNKVFGSSAIGMDLLENSLFPYQKSIGEGSLSQMAERQLSDMKFEAKFKSFLNTKRVK